MMSQPQNTHPRRDWLMAWTWPMFLQLQLDSRTQYMRIRQESKRATGCGNTTGTDWIICREFWKDQQSKKKSCAGCEHHVFQQRPILVALLKICIPRDLLHSIPSSTGVHNGSTLHPFWKEQGYASLVSMCQSTPRLRHPPNILWKISWLWCI